MLIIPGGDVSGVCFVLFFSDHSKRSNQNAEHVSSSPRQSKSPLEGKVSVCTVSQGCEGGDVGMQ